MTALLNAVSVLFKTFSLAIIRLRSLKKKRFPGAFIISVDNLSFGGTGKTSLVMDIGRELERKKAKFAIVSRGYRSRFEKKGTPVSRDHQPHEVGDEAALIKRAFSRQDIFIGRNRNRSIENALENGNRFIILDDGFQSAGIEKDLKIMLLNPGHPYYYLRNFRWLAGQEDVVLSLRSEGEIRPWPTAGFTASSTDSGPVRGEYTFKTAGFYNREQQPVDIRDSRILGFSAVGDNRRFRASLSRFNLAAFKSFRDHHRYSRNDILKLDQWRKRIHADTLACTPKDFIKIKSLNLPEIPLIYLENTLQFSIDLYAIIWSHAKKKGFI
jgi:tetraacyldisaccharide 4'-kinase